MVTNFKARKFDPVSVVENPQTDCGWVIVVSGSAYMPLTWCLHAAYKTAYKIAYNHCTESLESLSPSPF